MYAARDRLLGKLDDIYRDLAVAGTLNCNVRWRSAGRAVWRLREGLNRPMRLAVFGEDRAGKSSLINFLLKRQALPSGGLAGQAPYLLLHHSPEPVIHAVNADGTRSRLTSKAATRMAQPEAGAGDSPPVTNVIYSAMDCAAPPPPRFDTPQYSGTAASSLSDPSKLVELGLPHDVLKMVHMLEARGFPTRDASSAVTKAFRTIDIAIWCTLATQAWKESERADWTAIPSGRRRNALLLVTYKDAIRNHNEELRLLSRLRVSTSGLFSDVVPVSLRDAINAEFALDEETANSLRDNSNGEAVEVAVSTLAHHWHQQRMRSGVRQLRRIAGILRNSIGANADPLAVEFVARLEEAANDTGHGLGHG